MINLFGFLALGLALFALSNKNIIKLRVWHFLSSLMYILYGIAINAMPVIIWSSFILLYSRLSYL